MNVALGRRGDYAVRAVLDLARHHGRGRRKARHIAHDMDIPATFVPQVLADLVRDGVVVSVAGPDGGYELARPPDEVTLRAVVEAAEGPIGSTICILRGGPCRWEDRCAVHEAWFDAQRALVEQLERADFARLVAFDIELERLAAPSQAAPSIADAPACVVEDPA